MSKVYVISLGYQAIVVSDPEIAIAILSGQTVERDYVEGKEIWKPTENKLEVKCLSSDDIRALSKEEKENKELASAKSTAEWEKKQSESLRKQVEELKCQLKVALTKDEV